VNVLGVVEMDGEWKVKDLTGLTGGGGGRMLLDTSRTSKNSGEQFAGIVLPVLFSVAITVCLLTSNERYMLAVSYQSAKENIGA
jgi:hypothetical protein